MGAEVFLTGSTLTVKGTGQILGVKVDMSTAGELVPTIAAIAALATTPSEITGISHLRGHETDRIKALVTEINRIGGNAQELEDGIAITPANLVSGTWHTYADHRMATAGAIIGSKFKVLRLKTSASPLRQCPNFQTSG